MRVSVKSHQFTNNFGLKFKVLLVSLLFCLTSIWAGPVGVSSNKRYLVKDGKPLLVVADTGWFVFGKRGLTGWKQFINNRAAKGFTSIFATTMDNFPTNNGGPFQNGDDITKPIMSHWNDLKSGIEYAKSKGMVVFMTPCWMANDGRNWGTPLSKKSAAQLQAYGKFLGSHFKSSDNLVWFLGGDANLGKFPKSKVDHIINNIINGIKSVDSSKLMSYHPNSKHSSAEWYHGASWLNYNQIQDGTKTGSLIVGMVNTAYKKSPTKPVIVSETGYEGRTGYSMDAIRKSIYRGWFAGGFGAVYGHMLVYDPMTSAWTTRMNDPGATQIGTYMTQLMKDQVWHSLKPDGSAVSGGSGVMKMTNGSGTRALSFFPSNSNVSVKLSWFKGKVTARWFNTKTGKISTVSGSPFANSGTRSLAPGHSDGAVLILTSDGTPGGSTPEPTPEPTVTPDPTPPEPPTGSGDRAHDLNGTRTGATTIQLSWKAPSVSVKEYRIVLGANETVWKRVKTVNGLTLSTTLTSSNGIKQEAALLQIRAIADSGKGLSMSEQIVVPASSGYPEPAPQPPSNPGSGGGTIKIMPLGDSITDGAKGTESYRYTLWNLLKNAGYNVNFVGSVKGAFQGVIHKTGWDMDHEGHRGFTTQDVLAQLPRWQTSANPDVVLIHLGTNDIEHSRTSDATINDLSKIIDQLNSRNSKIKILLAKIIPSQSTDYNEVASKLNDRIAALVASKSKSGKSVTLVDQWSGFDIQTDLHNKLHPNTAGDQKMGRRWFEVLKKVLAGVSVPNPVPTPEPNPEPAPQPPAPPTGLGDRAHGLSGVRTGVTTIQLSWKAPSVAVSEYRIVLGANERVWKRVKVVDGSTLSTTLTSSNGINVEAALLQIRAISSSGKGLPMSEQLVVPAEGNQTGPTPEPQPPQTGSGDHAHSLEGVRTGVTTIQLSWKAPSVAVSEYRIVLGANERVWKRVKVVTGSTLSTTLTSSNGIKNEAALLQVRAMSSAGKGLPMSEQIVVAPLNGQPEPAPEPVGPPPTLPGTGDGDVTLVAIPDTQIMAQSYPKDFKTMIRWIANQASARNVKLVSHLGDMVQNGNNLNEYNNAEAAMDLLDPLLSEVSLTVGLGNHDYHADKAGNNNAPITYWAPRFGKAKRQAYSWYGGHSANDRNHYCFFNIGGYRVLSMDLQFNPTNSDLDWARSVFNKFPKTPTIVTTHSYLSDKPPAGRGTVAKRIWPFLSSFKQIFMVLGGHFHTPAAGSSQGENHQVAKNQAGLDVIEMLADYQFTKGEGWLRLIQFRVKQNRIDFTTYSPKLDRYMNDSSSRFSINMNFAQRFGSSLSKTAAGETETAVELELSDSLKERTVAEPQEVLTANEESVSSGGCFLNP